MAIWQSRYSRKLAAIERASLALNVFCKYNVELVLEGSGTLNTETLRRAVEVAARANPGSRVRLRGMLGFTRWVDSGIAPDVRELPAPGWDARSERGAQLLEEKFDALGGGPICRVIHIPGNPARIVFQALHAAVDGRSLQHWVSEVFRALRGETLLGSPCTYRDWDIIGKFQNKVDSEALEEAAKATRPNIPVIHCSSPRNPGAQYVWRTVVLPTLVPNVIAKFAVFLAAWARRNASGHVSFIVPVDLRTLREEVLSLGNLTGYLMIPIEPGASTRQVGRQLSLRVRQHADCHRTRILKLLTWLPMQLICRSIAKNLERTLYETVPDAVSGGVVSMGTVSLATFCAPQFNCTLAIPIPGFAGKINVVAVLNEHQTVVSFAAPESYNLDGQLDELVEALRRQFSVRRTAETVAVG
jgi:hypothetical protein